MVPELKLFIAAFLACVCFVSQSAASFAQSAAKSQLLRTSDAGDSSESPLDDEAKELLAGGKPGFLIESVRSEVLSLLSESNSCTGWFLSADASAREKFRSLHFVLDREGKAEIVRLDGQDGLSAYYHPYVASTRQNVAPGSTITVNANGAFFRSNALVRDGGHAADRLSASSYRPLSVGIYAGGSPEAQLLTVLHEFGHIVDLLPVDAEVPSAPFISIQNTETVLRHCRSQVQLHAKRLHKSQTSFKILPISLAFTPTTTSPKLQALTRKRSFRGELSYRYDGW